MDRKRLKKNRLAQEIKTTKDYWIKVFVDEGDDTDEYVTHSWENVECVDFEQALLYTSVMAKEIERQGIKIGVIEITDMASEPDYFIS